MIPQKVKKPLNFKMFYKSNANLMTTNYPFLSRSQINARLRTQWKKINDESKQKTQQLVEQSKSGRLKTHHFVDSSAKAHGNNEEFDHVSFWEPTKTKRNQTFEGGVFRLNRTVPEIQFKKENMSKTSILKKNSSPALKCKAGQVSFSFDVKKDSYDLSDDQKDENLFVEVNNTRGSTMVKNKFANRQDICNQMDSYEKQNHLLHKASNVQEVKGKHEPLNFDILNTTINNADKLDEPLTDNERLSEDENFYNFDEDDDDDAVLLKRRAYSYSPGFKKEYGITESKVEPANSSVGTTNMTSLLNKVEPKMKISHDNNCKRSLEFTVSKESKDLHQTPKSHSMILRGERQKVEENNKDLQNKFQNSEKNKPAKVTKRKDITSLQEEDIDSKMERFFRGGMYASREDSHNDSKVQKAHNKGLTCRYSHKNHSNLSIVAGSRTNKKESTDIDNSSSDSSEQREESPETFFYSQHDAEVAEVVEERRPIINHMFEDAETRTSNSVFTPAGKRLLTSNPFQTSSNFSTMLEDDDIFLQ